MKWWWWLNLSLVLWIQINPWLMHAPFWPQSALTILLFCLCNLTCLWAPFEEVIPMYHEFSTLFFLFGTKKMCLGFIVNCKLTNGISFFIIISLDKVRNVLSTTSYLMLVSILKPKLVKIFVSLNNELILICHIWHINCIFASITLSTRSLNFAKDWKPIETSIK